MLDLKLISILLTIPTIYLAAAVVVHFRSSLKAIPQDATGWLVAGVVISFVGQVLDNSYWQITWVLDWLGRPESEVFIQNGPGFNIFFRQSTGIAAALCHLRAAQVWGSASKDWVHRVYLGATISVLALTTFLLIASAVF